MNEESNATPAAGFHPVPKPSQGKPRAKAKPAKTAKAAKPVNVGKLRSRLASLEKQAKIQEERLARYPKIVATRKAWLSTLKERIGRLKAKIKS
jgi:hypothetical protein